MKPTFMKIAGCAAIALASAAAAQRAEAATVQYSGTIPTQLTELDSNLNIQQFNVGLGTLTGVEIQVNSNLDTVLVVSNNSLDASSYGTAQTEVQFTLSDPGSLLNSSNTTTLLPSATYGTSSSPLGAGSVYTSGTLTGSASSDHTYTGASILSEFSGNGTIALNLATVTQSLISVNNGGGNTSAAQTTHADGTVTVTYEYDAAPIPEPSPMAAALLGSCGLFIWSWRMRSSRK